MHTVVEPLFAPQTTTLGNVQGKYLAIVSAGSSSIWSGSILDVGCRGGSLALGLESSGWKPKRYVGIDISSPADVIADLGRGLPLPDKCFDTVVALDVLEHVDTFHAALAELARVAKQNLVISLPNAAEIALRFQFLLRGSLGGKFGLPPQAPRDRHRWVFSFSEARDCLHAQSQHIGFEISREGAVVGPRRAWLGRLLLKRFPDLLSTTYVAVLKRSSSLCNC